MNGWTKDGLVHEGGNAFVTPFGGHYLACVGGAGTRQFQSLKAALAWCEKELAARA